MKIRTIPEAKEERDRLQAEGKRVVFTNGCFDVIHVGHTRYLHAAREMGDYLIVAVNSDRSVRSIKGRGRPVSPENERAELLAALTCVDAVVIFDEETPLSIITLLKPDVLVKGGDWKEEEIVGADVVKAAGGVVRRIPFVAGHSTTEFLEKIRRTM